MKHVHLSFYLVSVVLLAVTAAIGAQEAQRVSPPRNWGLSFTMYNQFREGYESLPVTVTSLGGGKLSPHEKFRIEATTLANRSVKSVTSAEFTWYLFENNDLDKALDTGKTGLIDVALLPNEQRKCEILVLHIEDIPLLRDKNPQGTFRLEVGVTKVTYGDGSTWEAAAMPGKVDHSRMPR
jgi:hypothetical protein